MKLSEINKMPVVSISEATKLGVVSDAFASSRLDRIEAIEVAVEGRGGRAVVLIDQVRAIGKDVVTITGQDALRNLSQTGPDAQRVALNPIVGCRVVAEDGEVLGTISEIDVDTESMRVQALEYGAGGLGNLLGGRHRIEPANVIGIGAKVVTVKRGTEHAEPSSHPAA